MQSSRSRDDSRLRKTWQGDAGDHVVALAWSPDGKTLAAAAATGPITLFDGGTGKVTHTLPGHDGGTFAIAYLGPMLLSTGQDGRLKWWLDADELRNVECGAPWVEHLSVHGNLIATAAGKIVRIHDAAGTLVAELPKFSHTVSDLAWSKETLAVACYGAVTLWKPGAVEPLQTLAYAGSLLKLGWSPSWKWLAHGNQDASLHLWNLNDFTPLQMSGYATKVRALSWDSTGRYLATGGASAVSLWDCAGIGPAGSKPLMLDTHKKNITCIQYQHRGQLLASCSLEGLICLWQPHNKKGPLIGFDQNAGNECTSLAWSDDDKKIAVGFAEGMVGVFKV